MKIVRMVLLIADAVGVVFLVARSVYLPAREGVVVEGVIIFLLLANVFFIARKD